MSQHNRCFVVGNIGMDPVERARSEEFGPVVKFSVAQNVTQFDEQTKEHKTIHTNWFQITAFGTVGERVKSHLKKGDRVAVHGRMKVAKYQDKAGEERT